MGESSSPSLFISSFSLSIYINVCIILACACVYISVHDYVCVYNSRSVNLYYVVCVFIFMCILMCIIIIEMCVCLIVACVCYVCGCVRV